MDQTLKGGSWSMSGNHKSTGGGKKWQFWNSLLLQHPWTRKASLDHIEWDLNKRMVEPCPVLSAYGQNIAGHMSFKQQQLNPACVTGK